MGLPELRTPKGLPCFLLGGHAITPDALHDDFDVMQGHGRKRKVQTAAPRVVNVGYILEADEADKLDDWFENTLVVGNAPFTAEIAELGSSSKFWAAQWVAPLQWTPIERGRWQVAGQLLLTGVGSDIPPLGATLATEYRIDLNGSARITSGVSLATEYAISLVAHTPLKTEYLIPLDSVIPTYFEREDSGNIQREDGTNLQRE